MEVVKIGQYFLAVNLDKKEYIHPHDLNNGAKLYEIAWNTGGIATALIYLLRKSNETGGGDYIGDDSIVGSWAGDRIVLVGDYDESGLYSLAKEKYRNISREILKVMEEEPA